MKKMLGTVGNNQKYVSEQTFEKTLVRNERSSIGLPLVSDYF